MPQLTFPITRKGLEVDVRVNLDAASMRSLRAVGGPLPESVQARGLIDTGTDVTAVSPSILQQLGLPVQSHATSQGIGGAVQVRLFNVMLFILDVAQPNVPWFTQPDLLVMELPTGLPVEVLIGMDVLLTCGMVVDGPARQFTLVY
jgi:predicted aspartyl protease